MRNLEKDIELLHNLVNQVDDYTLTHFKQRDYQVYEKPDFTPVSDIDRGAEQMIRDFLKAHRPHDTGGAPPKPRKLAGLLIPLMAPKIMCGACLFGQP